MATLNPVINTLTQLRDHVAKWLGVTDYATLEVEEQEMVDVAISRGLRHISRDIKGNWIQRSSSITTGLAPTLGSVIVTLKGNFTTGSQTIANVTLNDIAINPLSEGLSAGDIIRIGAEGFYKIESVTTSSILITSGYPAATQAQAEFEIARNSYILEDGVIWINRIWDAQDAKEIQMVSKGQWLSATGGRWETGNPAWAIVDGADASQFPAGTGQKITIWPIPDDRRVICYDYYTVPTMPASGTLSFEVSPMHIDLLIHKSLEYVFWARQEPEERDRHAIEYQRLLKNAVREEMGRGDEDIFSVPQWDDGVNPIYSRFPSAIVAPFPGGVQ